MPKMRNPKGQGSYKKRSDGRYVWRQVVDGKTREVSARTPKELQEKINTIANTPILKSKITVEDWINKWLATYIEPLKKPATYDQYSILSKKHIIPAIGKRKLSTISAYDIQSVIAAASKKGLSTWTMKHIRKILQLAMKKAVQEKHIPASPVVDVEIPKVQPKEKKVLMPEEISALLKAMKNSRWYWSVRFCIATGLRRGELLALRWSDIEIANKRIKVDESNSLFGVGNTKSSKIHYIPLSDAAMSYLREQAQVLKTEVNPCLFNADLKKSDLIFPGEKGEMLKPKSYYTMVRRFGEKAGIQVYPHAFRHTFVWLMRGCLSLTDLQNALGHERSTTTLDIYGMMINESAGKTAKQINKVMKDIDAQIKKIETKQNKVVSL